MLELGVSQAQAQFTKILNNKVVIVDKKSNKKKAIILPYDEYMRLVKNEKETFNEFVGILDDSFKTDDEKYNRIIG
jgi:hypothetical protein